MELIAMRMEALPAADLPGHAEITALPEVDALPANDALPATESVVPWMLMPGNSLAFKLLQTQDQERGRARACLSRRVPLWELLEREAQVLKIIGESAPVKLVRPPGVAVSVFVAAPANVADPVFAQSYLQALHPSSCATTEERREMVRGYKSLVSPQVYKSVCAFERWFAMTRRTLRRIDAETRRTLLQLADQGQPAIDYDPAEPQLGILFSLLHDGVATEVIKLDSLAA